MIKSYVSIQRERKAMLRSVQNKRRSLEKIVNGLERRIRQKLSKKRLIDFDDATELMKEMKLLGKAFEEVYGGVLGFNKMLQF